MLSLFVFSFLTTNETFAKSTNDTVKTLQSQVKSLKATVTKYIKENSKLKESNAKLKKENTSLKSENEVLKTELNALGESDKELLVEILTSKKIYEGISTRSSDNLSTPIKMNFTYYDPKTDSFEGSIELLDTYTPTMHWASATHWIKGKIVGNQIIFKETDYVKKGDFLLNSTNILAFDKSTNRLTGYWDHLESSQFGDIYIDIK